MFFKLAFKYFSTAKKMDVLREDGVMLGTRVRGGRKVYLYMLKDFFVEVLYQGDNLDLDAEKVETFSNLDNLNSYLEREFRTAF
jgi:hypothetical protein